MAAAFDFSDYVGIPWLDRGRDLRGCDCWGLHRLVRLIGTGVLLPSHDDGYAGPADCAAIQDLIDGGRGRWEPVHAGGDPFDLVLLYDQPWHVGTLVRPGLMLHVPEGRTSVIETISTGRYRRRIEGIYRYRGLA
ncbi:hypothetical protein [Methylobacterium aquaticum]|uniref:NlpC/P60 domain-containing protein n=1 Tax=Methylobacterium aquaticum TaxID=270351 RepID=A0A0J6SWK5_9HYPH|nr:hypothetical protein [Methylobacterium aquaticum]KMO39615.1 hypothetical protein VP06_03870 [Methylobacterium aquaticum]